MWGVVAGLLLLVHALVHLRVWVWGGIGEAAADAHHSWLLGDARGVASVLAVVAAALFAVAGVGTLLEQDWAPLVAIGGGVTSIVLVALVFNRWLLVGLALDIAVIALAVRALSG
jgi:hypothetical protein